MNAFGTGHHCGDATVARKTATRWPKDVPRLDFVVSDWALDGVHDFVETSGARAWTLRYSALFETTCKAEVSQSGQSSLTITHDGVALDQMHLPLRVAFGPTDRSQEF